MQRFSFGYSFRDELFRGGLFKGLKNSAWHILNVAHEDTSFFLKKLFALKPFLRFL